MAQTKYSFQRGSAIVSSPGLFNAGATPTVGAQVLIDEMNITFECEEEEATEWSPPNNARQYDPGLISRAEFTANGFCAIEYKPIFTSWTTAGRVQSVWTCTFVSGVIFTMSGHEYSFENRGKVGSKWRFSVRVKWNGGGTAPAFS